MRWLSEEHGRGGERPAADTQEIDLLRESGLVDVAWYVETYPDIASTELDPVAHYLAHGASEGRNPNAFFDSAWYLANNPDVASANLNPLLHYIASDAAEGRSAGPDFDTAFYLAENPDIRAEQTNPLLHFLLCGRHEGRRGAPFDDIEAYETAVRAKQQELTGPAATLFAGARGAAVHFAMQPEHNLSGSGDMPLPPLALVQRAGYDTLENYEESGRATRDTIVRALPTTFSWLDSRCLDFGCDAGRVLRHFDAESKLGEFWGCDFDGSSIHWSMQNLSPPFHFVRIGEVPLLPFEDNYFDLVYATSALSRIYTAWQQWLMELRRVLKPGGVVFLSFLGQTPMQEMVGEPYWTRGSDFGMYIKGPHESWKRPGPPVFVSPAWIKKFLGSYFDVDFIAMDGLLDFHSFCVLRKKTGEAPVDGAVPVLLAGTMQPFSPDAVGRIHPQVDEQMHFRESYGLDVERSRQVSVEGWIAFRNDAPEQVEVLVDGQRITAEVKLEPGAPYGDWPNTAQTAFLVTVDLSRLTLGTHRFQTRIRSRTGMSHTLSIPLIVR